MTKYVKKATNRAVVANSANASIDPALLSHSVFHRTHFNNLALRPESWGKQHGLRVFGAVIRDHVVSSRPDLTATHAKTLEMKVRVSFAKDWTLHPEHGIPGRSLLAKKVVANRARNYSITYNTTNKVAVSKVVYPYVCEKIAPWLETDFKVASLPPTSSHNPVDPFPTLPYPRSTSSATLSLPSKPPPI